MPCHLPLGAISRVEIRSSQTVPLTAARCAGLFPTVYPPKNLQPVIPSARFQFRYHSPLRVSAPVPASYGTAGPSVVACYQVMS